MRSTCSLAFLFLVTSVAAAQDDAAEGGLVDETFEGLEWRALGPALMSGRIADIAIHPEKPSTWYVAVGSGNVWKTTNAGTTIDADLRYGDEPQRWLVLGRRRDARPERGPTSIWVGTGENVSGRHVGYGDGVYRSSIERRRELEKHMGLDRLSEHIGPVLSSTRGIRTSSSWPPKGPLWS